METNTNSPIYRYPRANSIINAPVWGYLSQFQSVIIQRPLYQWFNSLTISQVALVFFFFFFFFFWGGGGGGGGASR